jgi:drug/metabolite transporter (DMT)-like permease
MKPRDVLLCGGFALALPVGQLMFKAAAAYQNRLEGPLPARLLHNFPLMGALGWYGVTALLWFYILTRLPLSTAYVFSILGAALVPVLSWLVFAEPMSWRLAAGYAVMLAGLLVIMRDPGPQAPR